MVNSVDHDHVKKKMAENPSKKKRLSLSLQDRKNRKRKNDNDEEPSSSRFAFTIDEDAKNAAKGVILESTKRVNAWALKTFEEWIVARNSSNPGDPVPNNLLMPSTTPDYVCKWLSRFVLEVRQSSGKPYPPKSLYSVFCGLYRVSRSNGGLLLTFLTKKDHQLLLLHNTLDSTFSDLHSKGVGAIINHAAVISFDDEQKLLDSNIMSMEDPASLLNLVFFMWVCTFVFVEARNKGIYKLIRFVVAPLTPVLMTAVHITSITSSSRKTTSTDLKIYMLRTNVSKSTLSVILIDVW